MPNNTNIACCYGVNNTNKCVKVNYVLTERKILQLVASSYTLYSKILEFCIPFSTTFPGFSITRAFTTVFQDILSI